MNTVEMEVEMELETVHGPANISGNRDAPSVGALKLCENKVEIYNIIWQTALQIFFNKITLILVGFVGVRNNKLKEMQLSVQKSTLKQN